MNTISRNLSSHLFWDVDPSTLKQGESDSFIIKRVLEYGLLKDWKLIVSEYGYSKIKEEVILMSSLDDVIIAFLCGYFGLKKEQFKCYTHRQSIHHFWPY